MKGRTLRSELSELARMHGCSLGSPVPVRVPLTAQIGERVVLEGIASASTATDCGRIRFAARCWAHRCRPTSRC
jgi:hypothetical protein